MKRRHFNHYLLYYQNVEQQVNKNRQVQYLNENKFSFHPMTIIRQLLNENSIIFTFSVCSVMFIMFVFFKFRLFFPFTYAH